VSVVLTLEDEREMRALAAGYATSVDRRDLTAFLAVFAPDAFLRVFNPGAAEPRSVMQGHEQLARVIELISSYEATFHFLGQTTYAPIDGGATGEVYCTARHLTRTRHGATEFTMLIRYLDRYAVVDGGWRIVDRSVVVDWTSFQIAIPPATPRP